MITASHRCDPGLVLANLAVQCGVASRYGKRRGMAGKIFINYRRGGVGVAVAAGWLTMGSPASESERSSRRETLVRVTIAKPLAVGRYAITFDEWMRAASLLRPVAGPSESERFNCEKSKPLVCPFGYLIEILHDNLSGLVHRCLTGHANWILQRIGYLHQCNDLTRTKGNVVHIDCGRWCLTQAQPTTPQYSICRVKVLGNCNIRREGKARRQERGYQGFGHSSATFAQPRISPHRTHRYHRAINLKIVVRDTS